MEDVNVVIKVVDAANNLDFEIPISSGKNSPLSITKKLSDFTELTKRSGVQSRNFKIPISKEIASTYDFFNSAMHHNYKDIDEDKDAAIIINGNEVERGKIRVQRFSNKDGDEQVELLFYGNNFDWTEKLKNKTLADLTWINNVINYTPATIRISWNTKVFRNNEWVFPLESRGGRKVIHKAHTEDFRPAIFVYKLLGRALQSIGYTFSSTFMSTSEFRTLVLTHFGKRFKNTQEYINNNKVTIGNNGGLKKFGYTIPNSFAPFSTLEFPINIGNYGSFTWNDSTAPNTDIGNNFDPTAGTKISNSSGTFQGGTFTAPRAGYYTFKINMAGSASYNAFKTYSVPTPIPFIRRKIYSNQTEGFTSTTFLSITDANGKVSKPTLIGNISKKHLPDDVNGVFNWSGEVEVQLKKGDTVEVKQRLDGYVTNIRIPLIRLDDMTQYFLFEASSISVSVELLPRISEGDIFNLSDVVDDQVLVLDIINDLTKMFNLFWDTDPVLKRISIEPRDTFYGSITEAEDWTDRIDVSKEIKTRFNSSDHKRDFVFSYQQDSADKFVAGRNKWAGNLLGDYSHNLSQKFKDGKTTIKTKVLAPTYYVKDASAYYLPEEAPYTAMYFNEYIHSSPEKLLEDHKPRILNYQYGMQHEMRDGEWKRNAFWVAGEGGFRTDIPSVLPHQIKTGADVSVPTAFNLYWHTQHEQNGLFTQNWSKTITEISNGTNSAVSLLFDQKMWNEFNFNKIVYFDEPADIRGYWVVEKLSNYQPENSKLVRVKLLKRIEYDAQVEGIPSIRENLARAAPLWNNSTPLNGTPVYASVASAEGESINVGMLWSNSNGTTSPLYMTATAASLTFTAA